MLYSETGIARRYHQATKHSQDSLRSSRYFFDWRNEPLQNKIYPQIELLPLPTRLPVTCVPTLSVLQGQKEARERVPNLSELAYLLYFTGWTTKKLVHYGGETYFRAASSAGALYPIEVYLIRADLPGLEAGVIGGNLYLGAYALGRCATGLTFCDDEVIEAFSPYASGKAAIFSVAKGIPGSAETYRGQMVKIPPGGQVNIRD